MTPAKHTPGPETVCANCGHCPTEYPRTKPIPGGITYAVREVYGGDTVLCEPCAVGIRAAIRLATGEPRP